jgi:hypothetical protein
MKANTYRAADGTAYIYSNDPARGTFNQIAEGYAVMMMLVYPNLPPPVQQMARNDIRLMVLHVIDHNYKATERDGRPTTYGDMTPLAGPISVPFLRTNSPWRIECTAVAPTASATGTAPNFMQPPPSGAAPA